MDYVNLGKTGLKVSRICLGCMSFGVPDRGAHPWSMDEEKSRPFYKQALDLGINFFDTANAYSDGTSEEILGRAMKDLARREEVVIATKVYNPMRKDPNGRGLSRKAIFTEVDASLRRLGMDYIDLYQTHRWDYSTPIEETLEALHDVVKSGKVRYIGASSMFAWQFCKALYLAERHGWTQVRLDAGPLQPALPRGRARDDGPVCRPGNCRRCPGARWREDGWRGPWDERQATQRATSDEFGATLFARTEEADRQVIERVEEVAKARGLPQSQVALAWVLHKKVVTSPIVGATKPHHLEDAVAALSVELSAEEMARLEEAYMPHPVLGFS